MKDPAPRAHQLADLGTAGLEAIQYIEKQQAPPAGWLQSKQAALDQAARPAGLVRFTVLDPLRDLVNAAGK
ncbi:MAG: hypothetical protein JOZ83_12730 [Silvibacterium sp.]|nr:hypothetical protein [Silvibacterium sp.]